MSAARGSTVARLQGTLPQVGRVVWIGLRPARGTPMQSVARATVTERGLAGDRARSDKRAVTLIQAEHIPTVAALVGWDAPPAPDILRRNVAVAGINLAALMGRRFRIGSAVLEGTQACHPCSRMEAALGPGGWNAMRGLGGLCARVVEPGEIAIDDPVAADPDDPDRKDGR